MLRSQDELNTRHGFSSRWFCSTRSSINGRKRSGLGLTKPCGTRYSRISICGTAKTDFASLKVKLNCDAASRNLLRFVVVSFTGSTDGYIIEVNFRPVLKVLSPL